MELYKAYTKERTGNDLYICEQGFCEYKITKDVAEIIDMYIKPEFRGEKLSHEIVSQIEKKAKNLGCKNLYCQVDIRQNQAERSIVNNIKYGFKIAALDTNCIIFEKGI
jgi:hypothetical protein